MIQEVNGLRNYYESASIYYYECLGFVPGVGHVASFIDAFIVDRAFQHQSPKFFYRRPETTIGDKRASTSRAGNVASHRP